MSTASPTTESNPLLDGYIWGSRYLFAEPPRTSLGAMGNMLSRHIGSSLEFMEHREYLPGDDLRRIDWNAYARSDRLAVKMFREEVHPQVDLLLDGSRSMRLGDTRKADAALALAGFFAAAAAESHFAFACYLSGDGCRKLHRSNTIPSEWERPAFESDLNPAESLERMPPGWRASGIRIFLSDLMFPADPNALLGRIALDSAVTIVIQLLAEIDVEPPGHGNLRLIDAESGERLELFLDTGLRERYKQNLARHQEHWHDACRRHNATFTTLIAEEFLTTRRVDDLLNAELLRNK